MVGDAVGIFADAPAGVGADRVEVAQDGDPPGRVGDRQIAQDGLDHQLGLAIGLVALSGKSSLIGTRVASPYTVADELNTSVRTPCAAITSHNISVPREVVVIIAQRHGYRLADRLQAGEVDDRIDRRLGEDRVKRRAVQQIDLVECELPASELLYALQRLGLAVAQIIDDRDGVSGVQQLQAFVAANIPRAACDKNVHGYLIEILLIR